MKDFISKIKSVAVTISEIVAVIEIVSGAVNSIVQGIDKRFPTKENADVK